MKIIPLVLMCFLAGGVAADEISSAVLPPPDPGATDSVVQAAPPADPVQAIMGLGEDEARERIGIPAIARSEGLGGMWTYIGERCSLYVFFTAASPGEPRRVSGVSSGPRRRGDGVPSSAECLSDQIERRPKHDEDKRGSHRPG